MSEQWRGLSVENVGHAFGDRRVVCDVSFDVAPGEIVCLLGPSGCGKTTLLRIIAGLERLQSGRISANGRVLADGVTDVAPERREVGLLFQDFALFPHLTVRDNVLFGLGHLPAAERRARTREVLAQVGMTDYAEVYPHELSGGEQQRIALARARAPRPRVFLLDEPFSSLDAGRRHQLRELVLHILKSSTSSTVIVTHDPEEAMFLGDRVAVMRDGRIVQIATPETLYSAPADAFVAGLFSEVNRLDGVVVEGHVETPLGRVCAPHIADGTAVEVLIRPEAIRLDGADGRAANGGARPGTVVAARMLGRSSLIHLSVPAGAGDDLHVHARIPSRFRPSESAVVGLTLDQDQTFVFPAGPPRAA